MPCTGQRTNASRRINSQWMRARFHGSELRSYQRHFCAHSARLSRQLCAPRCVRPRRRSLSRVVRQAAPSRGAFAARPGFAPARPPARAARRGTARCASAGSAATSSGVPTGDRHAALLAALGPHVDQPVGALDHVEVVLDHDHAVARVHQPLRAPPAGAARRRSAGPWSARRGCTACCRSRSSTARSRASPAAPRRRTASWRAGRGACSRGRPRSSVSRRRRILGMCSKNVSASSTGMSSTSAMLLPLKRTSSVSRL